MDSYSPDDGIQTVKDAKPIFTHAIAQSEVMIVDRILVRVLPALLQYDQTLTADVIKQASQIPVPDQLYEQIRSVAEELTGCQFLSAQ